MVCLIFTGFFVCIPRQARLSSRDDVFIRSFDELCSLYLSRRGASKQRNDEIKLEAIIQNYNNFNYYCNIFLIILY